MNVKHISAKKPLVGKTNWGAIKLMTEEEIEAKANEDQDAPPLSRKELSQFKRVNPTKEIDVKLIRLSLGLSQEKFSEYFGVSVRTIQEWEQHRRIPTTTARNFLKVIEKEPKAVLRALGNH